MEEIICSCIQFCWFGAWAANTRKWKTSPMPFHSGEKGQVDGHMIGKSSLSVPVQAKGCRECMCVFSCLADKLKQCEEYYHIPSGVWFSSLQTPFFLETIKILMNTFNNAKSEKKLLEQQNHSHLMLFLQGMIWWHFCRSIISKRSALVTLLAGVAQVETA